MEYKNDKDEFIAFVNAAFAEDGSSDKKSESMCVCLERVTKNINENFLNARAGLYQKDVTSDDSLREAFLRLSSICNDEEQKCMLCPVGKYSEFWISKISRNRERDDEINKRLLFEGWTVIRFWGDEIKKHTEECVKVVEEAIFDIALEEKEDYEMMR